jgi:5-methylcytosine-specific restriction endonuclease McrA
VFYVAEPFTETTEERRVGRYIAPAVKMRVARRDNYMCQVCKTVLSDFDIEFDHIIPVAKGGSSEEHNLRVTCFACNREKGMNVEI